MRPLSTAIAVLALAFTASAQSRGPVAPGAGHYGVFGARGTYSGNGNLVSPPAGSIINPGIPNGLNLGSAWHGYSGSYRTRYGAGRGYGYGGGRGYGYGGGYGVLAYPIFVGGSPYDYGYLPSGYAPGYDESQQGPPPAPAVVINQNFIPDRANPMVREYGPEDEEQGMRNYQNAPPNQPEAEATIYLIAFRDHSVVPALAWWLEGNTLKYVNLDHDINQASVDLIDRDLSKKLNAQRNIDFTLPPQ